MGFAAFAGSRRIPVDQQNGNPIEDARRKKRRTVLQQLVVRQPVLAKRLTINFARTSIVLKPGLFPESSSEQTRFGRPGRKYISEGHFLNRCPGQWTK